MRIGQHSAKVIFFASADAWIQAKPLIKLMELKNISTTFRRVQPENKSKLRDLISATGPVLCEKLVSQGGTQEFTPKKNDLSAWYRPRGRNEFQWELVLQAIRSV